MNEALKVSEALKLFKELLDQGKRVPVRYTGTSMTPFLREGDWMEVKKPTLENVRIGSVVLFERGGELTVHRVCLLRRRNGALWARTRGDAEIDLDSPFPFEEILGVVASPSEKKGKAYFKARLLLFLSALHYVKIRLQGRKPI